MKFGERLTQIRTDAGWTQSSLARAIGTSQSAISQIEAGERNPSFEMIRQIAETLGLTPAYLLGEDVPQLSPEEQVHFREYRSLPQKAREELAQYAAFLRFTHNNKDK